MKIKTNGLHSGDTCPQCKKGNIEIRETVGGEKIKYAQCGKCSWNSLR